MKKALPILLSLLSFSVTAEVKSYSTPNHQPAIVIDGQGANQRICYYQDQAYSEGALLEVGGYLMRCDNANQYESNGRLKWVSFEKPASQPQSEPTESH